MYACGLVIPAPAAQMDAYRRWAENGVSFCEEYGCLGIVECWEDFVPDGEHTDFRRAVAAKDGEKIDFTWQIWPDKAFFEASEERMHRDERMDTAGKPPFDAKRLIRGCFEPIVSLGRGRPSLGGSASQWSLADVARADSRKLNEARSSITRRLRGRSQHPKDADFSAKSLKKWWTH